MTFNGRLLQEEIDKKIYELEEKLGRLMEWRALIDPYTFYECKEHGVYGIRSPDPIECKMCKRLSKK